MGRKVILVGGFHEIIELCELCEYTIVGIIDNHLKGIYYNYPIIGTDSDALDLSKRYKDCSLIVSPDCPKIREKLVNYYYSLGFKFVSLLSPQANISKYAHIGIGTIIQSGVNVSSETHIGRFVKLNTNCNVMHDNYIGDYTTIAPNAVTLGKVTIDACSYIGANSTILPNIVICKNCIVGAGSVVTKAIKEPGIWVGSPARFIKTSE